MLPFTPRQTCSISHHPHFPGKHSATPQLLPENYSYTNIHLYLQPGAPSKHLSELDQQTIPVQNVITGSEPIEQSNHAAILCTSAFSTHRVALLHTFIP